METGQQIPPDGSLWKQLNLPGLLPQPGGFEGSSEAPSATGRVAGAAVVDTNGATELGSAPDYS